MRWARGRLAIILTLLASVLWTAGCVNVPTSGPIEVVEGQQPPCQNCVNVEVAPPAPGDTPRQIVEGYLRATSNYQPNYSVARQFLTRMAAEKWSPEGSVSIYRGTVKPTGEKTVKLEGTVVGSLEKDRSYVARNQILRYGFVLAKENGQWRIENPPGLWVAEVSFKFFYQPYDLYFVGNGRSMVPDPIYLPALSNPANVASALMKALLNGPSLWLKPAVTTSIPPNTSLSVDSVTITDGIAEVQLGDSILNLSDAQRSLLAAQIAFTLKQVGGVKGVVIKVNQQPYRVPGADPSSQVILVDAISRDLAPIPSVAGEQAYAVKKGAVEQVTPSTDSPTSNPVPGPLGRTTDPVDAVAVSVTNTDLAVTTNGRTTLRRAPMTPGGSTTSLLNGATELLRPQFSRYGEIWEVGKQGGRQRLWMFTPENTKHEITSPVLQNVTAFKISPDGTRMALVRRTANGSELGLVRIIRSNQPTVEAWRVLDTSQSGTPIRNIADVAWLDATNLLVLSRSEGSSTLFRVAHDASHISQKGEAQTWDADELAVSPQTQSAIVVGSKGGTWKDDGNQWQPFLDHAVSSIAYPG
ncbi:MAG TPA: LpqB family beta-propeller domain-containing protein [Propionibacteriaceae bacterium]|nr:LpqB family beta-propeller domain-containing protein [Propionibacteriaceae bacterium]